MITFLLKRNIKLALKKQEKMIKVFLNFNQIECILIVFDFDNWLGIKPIVDDLIKNNKHVILWTIGRVDTSTTYIKQDLELYAVRVVNPKTDVKWIHIPQPHIVTEYDALEYDTFLDLSFEKNLLMLYLKASSHGRFSIGLQQVPYKLYNFILFKEEDKNLVETYRQLKSYLSSNTRA